MEEWRKKRRARAPHQAEPRKFHERPDLSLSEKSAHWRPDGFRAMSGRVEAEYFSTAQLAERAREMAARPVSRLPRSAATAFQRQLATMVALIDIAYRANITKDSRADPIPPAAEWLLDNYLLIKESARQVRRDLPVKFYTQLPASEGETATLTPRVMALARSYARHSHFEVAKDRLTAMVCGYQEIGALRIGELWATPAILRFVIIEELAQLAYEINRTMYMRERANSFADLFFSVKSQSPKDRAEAIEAYEPDADDDSFASQLLYRISGSAGNIPEVIGWLEARLQARDSDIDEVQIAEQNRQAARTVQMGNLVRSLRLIDDIDWSKWVMSVSRVDAVLSAETNFGALDFNSQTQYRTAIEELSRWSGTEEYKIAEHAVALRNASGSDAPDIGSFFIGPDRVRLERAIEARVPLLQRLGRRFRGAGFAAIATSQGVLTLAIMAAAYALLSGNGTVGNGTALALVLLALLPASEAATGLFNTMATAIKKPTRLVGYKYEDGIPPEEATLVVIPCLIGSYDTIDDLVRALEVHYLSNPKGEISFALLSDWPDSAVERSAEDDALLDYARAEITSLSDRYASDGRRRFHILHRTRLYNEAEGVWMGWERKRGKLTELNALLRGDTDTTFLDDHEPLPERIVYVLTLDADTRLTRGAVTRLVGKLAHPLNQPSVDPKLGRVTRGYGIMQPRVMPSLTSGAEASAFQRIFSINRGFDPYVFTVSDVYQDLTGEGSFVGKGIYHVDTFREVIGDRIAENTVLSHDLLEGNFARCALVTDVELVEDFPTHYSDEIARQHRWARGDWQLLPFIFNPSSGVSALNRYKMLDNLRRSLVPIAWIGASVLGWNTLDAKQAVIWQLFLMLSLFMSPTLALIRETFAAPSNAAMPAHGLASLESFSAHTAQVLLRTVFIAHSATTMADAIVRTLYRLFSSRRHLLEWQPSGQGDQGEGVLEYWATMRWSIALGVASLALTIYLRGVLPLALLFGALWVFSPFMAWWFSRSAETEDRLVVTESDRIALRKTARRTWSYFETFVTAEHNWLPPDNIQEIPKPVVAARTSPTNIGLYLLSVISARDFGWIGLRDTVNRIENTVNTVEKLEKYNGHLLNWYDTKRAVPLDPGYVSTVDSGNLAGHLIAVAAACREWADDPLLHSRSDIDGLIDIAEILKEDLNAIPDGRRTIRPLRHNFSERIDDFRRAVQNLRNEPEHLQVRVISVAVIAADIDNIARHFAEEVETPQAIALTQWATLLKRTCEIHIDDATLGREVTKSLRERLEELHARCRGLAFSMDFRFLFNKSRTLLSIGYQVEKAELDEACYDLLASEARLASFFGIAKGDLPTEHWFRLGRRVVPVRARGALLSWSGSMFEYLMPTLVMQEQQGGILNQSNVLAIRRQIQFARDHGIPWGISESAFNARDRDMTYQYMTFGVPSLGMKRGLGDDLVVAPYATILASQFLPAAAVLNLKRLTALGGRGDYGFFDAIDFTRPRLPDGKSHVVVRNYMAHHHGMSITAIANVVHCGQLRHRFHSDPVIEAAELLLQEKAPRVVTLPSQRHEAETMRGSSEHLGGEHEVIEGAALREPAAAVLSNGHYSAVLSARGAGQGMWNGQAVTRWDRDPLNIGDGPFIFLRDAETGSTWSATPDPCEAHGESVRFVLSDNKVEYHKTVGNLRSQVEVIVANDHDAEGRQLTLFNTGNRDRLIEVTSYSEPVVGDATADFAHPAFSRMFLRTEISADGRVIHVERNPRGPGEPDMKVAHMCVDCGQSVGPAEAETDRRRFVGRGRTLSNAAAFDQGAQLSGTDGFTLDPVLSLRRTIRVPAKGRASVIFWTMAAPSRAEIDRWLGYFNHEETFQHEAMQAWTRSQIQLRQMGSTLAEAAVFQKLARFIVFPDRVLKSGDGRDAVATQSALWPMGISGDHPIMVLRIDDEADIAIARKAVRAQEYFRTRGLMTDLVIMNERKSSYAQDLQNAIGAMCESAQLRSHLIGDHIFALRRDLVGQEAYDALLSLARIVLHARNGSFAIQIQRAETLGEVATAPENLPERDVLDPSRALRRARAIPAKARDSDERPLPDGSDLDFWNGFGGFSSDGREYVIRLRAGDTTPHPWINVIANTDQFGFHISAEGAGFTWSMNSRDHKLTSWSNDPVSNRPGEAIFVVDRDSGAVASPFAVFAVNPQATFETRHGAGYSIFTAKDDNLVIRATQIMSGDDPVKLTQLRITNTGHRRRRLRVYGYVEWVLGTNRDRSAPHIKASYDPATEIIFAENDFIAEFADRTAFLACDAPLSSVATQRKAFMGAGSVLRPDAVWDAALLSGAGASRGDACAALTVDLELDPDETREVTLLLGDAEGTDQASQQVARHRGGGFGAKLNAVAEGWDDLLDALQVETPDRAMNIMINRWLPYQTLACRIRARSAFYQASGAFGFRDQLQDTLALLLQDPTLARAQILNAASRQFPEGDVQHWWLPRSGAGVRTTISDDVVWLSYAVTEYIDVTGDAAILDEELPFLTGPELEPGQHDAFFHPEVSDHTASLYEHCALALDCSIKRTGPHGLSLFLGGDWNDGMNRVGEGGTGESVWLSWFLAHALHRMIPVAKARVDRARANRWRAHLARISQAIEADGWDGSYYRRGYYDDGTPLGSKDSEECRIDSIAQSWSVLSGQGDGARSRDALDQVMAQLVDRDAGIVKLFTPPFSDTPMEPGYIKGYPPGVRENGGQYTHASAWVVYALAMIGRGDDAKACFDMLNPVNHALSREAAQTYRVEPYVAAADIYAGAANIGRGGWTWYTGSAGWLYRAGVEAILGIRKRGDKLFVTPSLPGDWDGYTATLRIEGRSYRIVVKDGTVQVNETVVSPEDGYPLI